MNYIQPSLSGHKTTNSLLLLLSDVLPTAKDKIRKDKPLDKPLHSLTLVLLILWGLSISRQHIY